MSKWSDIGTVIENDDSVYKDFIRKLGVKKIDHISLILFGDPMNSEFLNDISITKHVYSTGDKMSKIAYKHYGDASLWWVVAWFNGRPTDFHCNVGDTLLVPHPIEEVLLQAYSRTSI